MKINFERTGGFAGMRLAINLDLDSLSAENAPALQKLISDADLFNIPDPVSKSPIRDGFQYTISVENQGLQRTLRVGEGSIPTELLSLINDLSLRARANRSQ